MQALAGVTMVVLVTITLGTWIGWSRSWQWIESHRRLDVGAPTVTEPYPEALGEPLARLVAAGDVGTGGAEAYATAAAMDVLERSREFDALLLLGDNVYPSGDPDQVQAKVYDPFGPVLDGPTELVAALGNHDVRTAGGDPMVAALDMPGRWYTSRYGPIRVVVVDSTRPDDRLQLSWLREVLSARSDASWTVVIQHHPPVSAGYHGSHEPSGMALVPLYEELGVDLVLAGHDHDYQRTSPQRGVTYVVSGAAAKLRPTARATFTELAASTYSFVELAAFPDRLEIRAVDQDGRVFDSFEVPAPT